MLKYIGIILLSSCFSAYGAFLSSSIKLSCNIRQDIIVLLKDIERGIKYANVPIIQIIKNAKLPYLSKTGFCDNFYGSESSNAVINSCLKALSEKDREMLFSFFSQLGRSAYGEYELKNCRYFIDYFEKTQQDIEKVGISKSQLYKKLGLITGIMTAIIFI